MGLTQHLSPQTSVAAHFTNARGFISPMPYYATNNKNISNEISEEYSSPYVSNLIRLFITFGRFLS